MGHLGLTPQSVNQFGGFRPQAKSASAAKRLLEDAVLLEEAGCFSLVLESVPSRLARARLQETVHSHHGHWRGQSAVTDRCWSRMTSWVCSTALHPSSSRNMPIFMAKCERAFAEYISDVRGRVFPAAEHSVEMDEAEWEKFLREIEQ